MDPDPEWTRREKADRMSVVLVPGFETVPRNAPCRMEVNQTHGHGGNIQRKFRSGEYQWIRHLETV